jgi:hypothetical protein
MEWNYSYLPGYSMQQSVQFGGSVALGMISDEEAFKRLML